MPLFVSCFFHSLIVEKKSLNRLLRVSTLSVVVGPCEYTNVLSDISHSKASVVVGKAALGFGQDRIRTLISKAKDSSHRVIMGKICAHFSAFIFNWISFYSCT